MIRKLLSIVAVAALACAFALPVASQPSGAFQAITPITRDLGALQTLTAQAAATVTSSDQSGYNVSRIICVFRQASETGSPSSTFTIQGKDAASGVYYSLITSAAVTDNASTNVIYAGAGLANVANVSAGIPIPRTWRTSITVGGSATPLVTGTIGCSVQ